MGDPAELVGAGGAAAQALTQYHVLVLGGGHVWAINQVSGGLVQDIRLAARLGPGPPSQALGLACDDMAAAVFCYTGAFPLLPPSFLFRLRFPHTPSCCP